jgi:hypothetical protein
MSNSATASDAPTEKATESSTEQNSQVEIPDEMSLEQLGELLEEHPELKKSVRVHGLMYRGEWLSQNENLSGDELLRRQEAIDAKLGPKK